MRFTAAAADVTDRTLPLTAPGSYSVNQTALGCAAIRDSITVRLGSPRCARTQSSTCDSECLYRTAGAAAERGRLGATDGDGSGTGLGEALGRGRVGVADGTAGSGAGTVALATEGAARLFSSCADSCDTTPAAAAAATTADAATTIARRRAARRPAARSARS
ncbi:hypothetical protein [Streptomyces sp. NBC_00829]|uniref:hypothetical protein n=1 Tax=Streptomyces sp. NBC_00829 TaxID=2903679 RepID=UPI003866326B